MELKFYMCETCGKMIAVVKGTPVPTMCCGKPMKELIPGTSDGAVEKHVPVVSREGNTVAVMVGEVEHPMVENHHIEWIALETADGFLMKKLNPGDAPKAIFVLNDAAGEVSALAYCNLHGLWKSK